MKRLCIVPILDLCHFGLPDWVGNVQNADFPMLFHGYCNAVAEHYPWVRFYPGQRNLRHLPAKLKFEV